MKQTSALFGPGQQWIRLPEQSTFVPILQMGKQRCGCAKGLVQGHAQSCA